MGITLLSGGVQIVSDVNSHNLVDNTSEITVLTSSLNPSTPLAVVVFTATVAQIGGLPVPTGTVTFFDSGTPIGSPVTLSGGVAAISTSALSPGSHSITATYAGDGSYDGSTSPVLTQVVSGTGTPASRLPFPLLMRLRLHG